MPNGLSTYGDDAIIHYVLCTECLLYVPLNPRAEFSTSSVIIEGGRNFEV